MVARTSCRPMVASVAGLPMRFLPIAKRRIAFMRRRSILPPVADSSLSATTTARVGVRRCGTCRRRLITYAILQDTQDANVIYLGTNLGVYRSLDRGASWAPVWAPTPTRAEEDQSRRPANASSDAYDSRPAAPRKPTVSVRNDYLECRRLE